MSYERADTACTRSVVQWVINATRGWRELHGHVVSGRERVSLPRSGLTATVPELPLEDRRGQRYSSPVVTAREPRPVVQRRRDQVVDEPSVDGADEKSRSEQHVRRARASTTPSRSTRRGRGRQSLAGQRCC